MKAAVAVAAGVACSAAMAVILLTVATPHRCPGWHLPNTARTSLWQLFSLWTVPIIAFNAFLVVRWNWVARRAAETGRPSPVPVTYILLGMCLLGSATSQVPLALLVVSCTRLALKA